VDGKATTDRHRDHNEQKESDLAQGISKSGLTFFGKNIILLQSVVLLPLLKEVLLVSFY